MSILRKRRSLFLATSSERFLQFSWKISQLRKKSVEKLNDERISQLYEAIRAEETEFYDLIKTGCFGCLKTVYRRLFVKISKDKLVQYAAFWNKYRYVYPYCDLSKMKVEPESFADGVFYGCYKAKLVHESDATTCDFKIPPKFFLKKIGNCWIYPKEYGISELEIINLNTIWPIIFAGLYKCKYIHCQFGIITEPRVRIHSDTNFYGLVLEAADYDLENFLNAVRTLNLQFFLESCLILRRQLFLCINIMSLTRTSSQPIFLY